MKNTLFWFGLILLFLLSYWSVKPLLEAGYFPMHDDTQIARVVTMGNALKEGQFPVRWVSDLGYGYGYPIYNFYGPLPYYVGGAFYSLGVNPILATKLMFGIGIVLAAIFCYILLFPVAGVAGAVAGSVLFVYAPYHAVQVYVRGAVGEYWAIAFAPLLLLGVYKIIEKNELKGIAIGGVGLFGVIVSHTITGLIAAVLIVSGVLGVFIYQLIKRRVDWYQLLSLCALCLIGMGLSAFFWLPALSEMRYTGVSRMISTAPTVFSDHFLCISQLWNSLWGFGGSASGCMNDGMSFKIGKFHIVTVLCIAALLAFYTVKKQIKSRPPMLGIAMVAGIASIFGTLEISKPFWNIFPYTAYIQYPWRLLSVSMLFIGVFCGIGVGLVKKQLLRYGLAICIVVLTIVSSAKLFRTQYTIPADLSYLASKESIRYRISKISDEYLPEDIVKPMNSTEIPSTLIKLTSDAPIIVNESKITNFSITVNTAVSQSVTIQKAYFPGWEYKINGLNANPVIIHGLPVFRLSTGRYTIEGDFTNTRVRSQANIISILFVVLLGGIIYYGYKTNA